MNLFDVTKLNSVSIQSRYQRGTGSIEGRGDKKHRKILQRKHKIQSSLKEIQTEIRQLRPKLTNNL